MGGAGGDAWGGALAVLSQGTATLRDCTLDGNRAIGGDGRYGGLGLGGGIYVAADASVRVKKTEITHNRARGGDGAPGGSDGQGIGGGVYNLGALLLDAFTVIKKNYASISDDDIFG